MQLPAELREQIWEHAVTEWSAATGNRHKPPVGGADMLEKAPIRMDRFNRIPPPAITRTSRQLRHETLHLYYEHNVFECWRPVYWVHDWTYSTLIDWLTCLGPRTRWLNNLVLLYKHESELDHDVEPELRALGFDLKPGVIHNRQELSEYELSHEALGLPRHFGSRGNRRDRWFVARTGPTS
jgi:hypothetical protein